ncbi:uncharacterized protein MONBRDRAFT_31939 [Monosiga brevicollis MX1]|uniref:Protein kinase domain-containing protein n=1 Tax=Monosiga brevicollis TaxID=81824 RepID=A9UWE1_MONBE|nr:uncharacterized protein MONBRDRAFT_31939 [Monosiga brevicollis MX1]EDQ90547.1 predicted protein [Monosiga brevicollis MX1]|eukprot:XP_001744598.1 hypothetical protein [Monosiga brevicollis MX1]
MRRYYPTTELQLRTVLGEGSFGCVYAGRWRGLDVAVKSLFDDQMFQEEAELLCMLSHRHIVRYIGECIVQDGQDPPELIGPNSTGLSFALPGRCLMITELADRGTLYETIYTSEYSHLQAARWLYEVGSALAYLHYEAPVKLLHLDVKPLNILMASQDGSVVCKLADLGTAMIAESTEEAACVESRDQSLPGVRGTIRYLAPELIRSECISDRADVWSFGVTACELFAKSMPFAQYSNNLTVTFKLGSGNMHPDIPSSMPACLRTIIASCFAQQHTQRPSSNMLRHQFESALMELENPRTSRRDQFAHHHTESMAEPTSISPRQVRRHQSLPPRRRPAHLDTLVTNASILDEDPGSPAPLSPFDLNGNNELVAQPESLRTASAQTGLSPRKPCNEVEATFFNMARAAMLRHKQGRLDKLAAELQAKEERLRNWETDLQHREAALLAQTPGSAVDCARISLV